VREDLVVVRRRPDLAAAVCHAAQRVETEERRREDEAARKLKKGEPRVQVGAVDDLEHEAAALVDRTRGGEDRREREQRAVHRVLLARRAARGRDARADDAQQHDARADDLHALEAGAEDERGEEHGARDCALHQHRLRHAEHPPARVQREQALHRVEDRHREQRMLRAAPQLARRAVELGLQAGNRREEEQVRGRDQLVQHHVERAHRHRHHPEARTLARAERDMAAEERGGANVGRGDGEEWPRTTSPPLTKEWHQIARHLGRAV
jgi:hypothetical protein